MNPVEKRIAAASQAQSADEEALFGQMLTPDGCANQGRLDGQPLVLAGTNNYLGLTFHPELIDAAQKATGRYGVGTTGSRMANGTFPGHVQLEQALCEFFNARSALLFTTGYQANLAVLAGLSNRNTNLLLDADSHASIYDGATLSGARVFRFRHNDVADLDRTLNRLGDQASETFVVVEGIYSMFGDTAPLKEICAVVKQYGAALIVDEAHSFGVLGANGRGLAEREEVEDMVDVIVGTFSKSAASVGGFCASARHDLTPLRRHMRAYVFSASMSPAVVAAATAALKVIQDQPQLREKLWHNAHCVYHALSQLGLKVGPEVSPVVSVTLADPATTMRAWQQLIDHGVYVNLVLPPAAPNGKCLLRCSVTAAHSEADVEQIIDGFSSLVET